MRYQGIRVLDRAETQQLVWMLFSTEEARLFHAPFRAVVGTIHGGEQHPHQLLSLRPVQYSNPLVAHVLLL